MFEDAEKKIARLMAESTTSSESKASLGKIKMKGRGNLVALGDINLTVHINALPPLTLPKKQAEATDTVPQVIAEDQCAAIQSKCREIGDPDLYRPFIKAAYGASRLEDLGTIDLGRVEWWLGIRDTRP